MTEKSPNIYQKDYHGEAAEVQSETFIIHDVDRYISDDLGINTAMQRNKDRISIGVYLTQNKVGLSGYQEYWHYGLNERKQAQAAYKKINSIIKQMVEQFEYEHITYALVKPFIRNRLKDVDKEHKERSGVYHYNWYTELDDKAEDWRETIYGHRYPDPVVEKLDLNWNAEEPDRILEVSGTNSRNKQYKYKYAEEIQKTATNKRLYLPSLALLTGLSAGELMEQAKLPEKVPALTQPAPNQPTQAVERNENPIEPTTQPISTQPATQPAETKQSRGIRNNNPGNIEKNDIDWQGMSSEQTDGRFIVFEYPEDGIRAMSRVLRNYQRKHNLNTINAIISRWAPASENDTNSYARNVAQKTGLNENDPIDLQNDDVLLKIVKAIIQHENGTMPYDDSVLHRGIEAEKTEMRPWAKAKDIPIVPDSPKIRAKHPPNNMPNSPFYSPQQELSIFKKPEYQKLSFENIRDIDVKPLVQMWTSHGLRWPDIVRKLKEAGITDRTTLSKLWQVHVTTLSGAYGQRWHYNFSKTS